MNKPTRRQHTVWRNYLRAWAPKDKIWCAMAHKPFPADLMNVGQERDFYRIRDMTDSDVETIRAVFITPMKHSQLRQLAERWIESFDTLRLAREWAEQAGLDASRALERDYLEADEKLHGAIEQNAIPLLNQLLAADEFSIADDDYGMFAHYLMTQYFRTSRMVGNLERSMDPRFQGTLERSIGVLRHILATSAGFTLLAERESMKATVLVNHTQVQLITGDQPVINMLAVELPPDVMVDDCEFYYPLSPGKALIIARSPRFTSGRIDDPDVARNFNRLIALSAERQVYGAKLSDLKDVLDLVGRHAVSI